MEHPCQIQPAIWFGNFHCDVLSLLLARGAQFRKQKDRDRVMYECHVDSLIDVLFSWFYDDGEDGDDGGVVCGSCRRLRNYPAEPLVMAIVCYSGA